jgi:hypothetical protein
VARNCDTGVRPKTLREFIRSSYFWRPFVGLVIGGMAGFLNYYFNGYGSDFSTIAGNPYLSVMIGGFLGYFVLNNPCLRKCK